MTNLAVVPYRLNHHSLLVGRLFYALLLLVCLGMFAIANYGQAVQWAFGDCGSFYVVPGYEATCVQWRAAIHNIGFTPAAFVTYFIILRIAAALPFILLSVLLIRRRGEELRVLLLAGFLLLVGVAGPIYNPFWQWARAWFTVENQVPVLLMVSQLLDFLLSVSAVMFVFLFPDGRFVPRWARWMAGLWLIIRAGEVFFPDTPAALYTWSYELAIILNTTIVMGAVGAMIWRYRVHADPIQRQQIKWVTAGALLLSLNYGLDYAVWEIYPAVTNEYLVVTFEQGALWELFQDTLWYVSQFIFAVCMGLAVFRHRLWDIDIILSRTLVYGSLTAAIIALYILIVGGLGAVFHTQTTAVSGLAATGIIAVIFQPLRERLQRLVNRLLYGERDDPAAVLSRLAHHLETANIPSAILPNLVQTIAGMLRIPHVAIHLPVDSDQREPFAVWGEPSDTTQAIPLIYQNEAIGQLIVAPRGPQEMFSRHEQQLLAAIAALTAATVRAVQMSSEVQRSRQHIITSREEERRRIRRDLHDGLGPALASMPLKIDAAVDLIEQDRLTSVRLLSDVKKQAQQLVTDVRQVVHDLRPPALDELGLAEALRGAIAQLQTHPNRLQISFDADQLPHDLPAAVEAATYRITMEAVTNVLKHAQAHHCWVAMRIIEHPSGLQISIKDDGIGLPHAAVTNIGLRSMRERAEELGGTFQIQPRPTGGTCITVSLPLSETSDER